MTAELIARLESADGPDRELFEAAFDAAFPMPRLEDEPEWAGPGTLREPLYHAWYVRKESIQAKLNAGAWTSAAEMLVPEGWHMSVNTTVGALLKGSAAVRDRDGGPSFASAASTPGQALASAALKARGV